MVCAMKKARVLSILFVVVLLAVAVMAEAQQPKKVHRIGYLSGLDPVQAGLVESLPRPGGNVTGVTNLGRELGGKRLELLKEAGPQSCPCRGSPRASIRSSQ